jgi:hypothetical protein
MPNMLSPPLFLSIKHRTIPDALDTGRRKYSLCASSHASAAVEVPTPAAGELMDAAGDLFLAVDGSDHADTTGAIATGTGTGDVTRLPATGRSSSWDSVRMRLVLPPELPKDVLRVVNIAFAPVGGLAAIARALPPVSIAPVWLSIGIACARGGT